MLLFTFLLLPLYALAATSTQQQTPTVVLKPAGPPTWTKNNDDAYHHICSKPTHHRFNTSNPAAWDSCISWRDQELEFAFGEWICKRFL
ncbi:hypothetical protein F4776DRAFT_640392 [Hypoxylon sp. NC0597]|nr:hypothetical protein F4776DRAFT_640392 [Hypoxylon sp. NC0597]